MLDMTGSSGGDLDLCCAGGGVGGLSRQKEELCVLKSDCRVVNFASLQIPSTDALRILLHKFLSCWTLFASM